MRPSSARAAEGFAQLRLDCRALDRFATTVGMEGLAALMAAVADRIAAMLPRQASFCRYGDQEFLLWFPSSPTPMPWRPSPGS